MGIILEKIKKKYFPHTSLALDFAVKQYKIYSDKLLKNLTFSYKSLTFPKMYINDTLHLHL